MADILRNADAVWQGDLRGGKGTISTPSGVLNNDAYTHGMRFGNDPGTNPEELIAAAHAACFTMNFSGVLGKQGFTAENLSTHATLTLERTEAGNNITKMLLEVVGKVPNIDEATFRQLADTAEKTCPISKLLSPGLKEIQVIATLK